MLTIEVGVAIAFAAALVYVATSWRKPRRLIDPAPLSAPLDDRSGLVEERLLMVRAQLSRALA